MNFFITFKKGILGFLTGLSAIVVLGIVEAMTNFKPTACSETITTDCTPQLIITAYYAIVPAVTGVLVGVANWLKNRNK